MVFFRSLGPCFIMAYSYWYNKIPYIYFMRKIIPLALLIIGLQLASTQVSSAQKLIRIDERLKINSQQMKAKRKGVSSVGKYEFGPYRVISGKGGWTKSSSKSPLFSDNSSMKSSSSKSFVFVNDKSDTAIANISIAENVEIDEGSWFIRTFTNWAEAEVQNGEGIFECTFSYSCDTAQWNLVVIYPVLTEVDGMYQMDDHTEFRGVLSNNQTLIEIAEVTINDQGKSPLLNPVKGYEFWQDSKALAAVQVFPVNRVHVWLRDDLDAELSFVLASAAAAMLVKTF